MQSDFYTACSSVLTNLRRVTTHLKAMTLGCVTKLASVEKSPQVCNQGKIDVRNDKHAQIGARSGRLPSQQLLFPAMGPAAAGTSPGAGRADESGASSNDEVCSEVHARLPLQRVDAWTARMVPSAALKYV